MSFYARVLDTFPDQSRNRVKILDTMDQNFCGSSSLYLSRLGIGCWSFGGSESDYWGAQDQSEVEAMVNTALDKGVTYFDTAEAYNDGRSETALGRALKHRRMEAVIGTKVWPNHASPVLLRKHCEASLRRLDTDFIDLYMLHWPLTEFPLGPALQTLAALKEEGKIRHIGLSNFGVQQLREVAAVGVEIAANQLCYSLLSRAIEFEILPECVNMGIGVIAYMPLQQGLLTGKYHTPAEVPDIRARTRHFSGSRPLSRHGEPGAEQEVFDVLAGLRVISAETGIPISSLALAWAAHRPGITCALAGLRSRDQLAEAVEGSMLDLGREHMAKLTSLTESVKEKLGSNADYFAGSAESRIR